MSRERDDQDGEVSRVPVIRMSEGGSETGPARHRPPDPIDEPLVGEGGKRVFAGILLTVAAFFMVRLGAWIYYGSRIERAAKSLEARIGPLDPASLNTPPVPEAENRARELKRLLPLACGTHMESQTVAHYLDAPEDGAEDMRRVLVERQDAILGIEAALGPPGTPRPRVGWGVDYSMGYRASLPSPGQLVTAGRLLAASALAGDQSRFLASLTASLRLAASLEGDRVLVLQNVRSEMERRALTVLRVALADGRLDAATLALLAAELPPPADRGLPVPGLEGEVKSFHALFEARVAYGLNPSRWLLLPLYQRTHLRWLEYFDACYAALEQPRGSRPRFPVTPLSWFILARPVTFSPHVVQLGERNESRRKLARAAVALALARSRDGTFPASAGGDGILLSTSGDQVLLSVPGLAMPPSLRESFEWTVAPPAATRGAASSGAAP